MNSLKTSMLYATLLMLAVLTTLWSYQYFDSSDPTQAPSKNAHLHAYANEITITQYNEQGKPRSQVSAPYEMQYLNPAFTSFLQPRITLYPPDKTPWHISSGYGQARDNFTTLQLWDNVDMQQAAGAHNREMRIQMPYVNYFPKRDRVTTDAPVKATQTNATVTSVGLIANTANSTVHFLSQVRSRYEPDR